jgi:hypothetical protein
MSDYPFTYHSSSYSLDKAADYGLFIKAGKKDFSLLIAEGGRLVAWKNHCVAAELDNDFDLGRIMAQQYKNVIIGLEPEALTLVPKELFVAEHASDYARFLDVTPEDKVFASVMDSDNQVIYKTGNALVDKLLKKFNVQQTVPAHRGWLAAIAKSEPANYTLYMDVSDDQITLLNFNGGKVRFYNCFSVSDVNDILYYSLFVAERLELQPDYTTVIVSGRSAASDFDKLGEFFRIVKYNDLTVLETPQGVPAHQMLALAALA